MPPAPASVRRGSLQLETLSRWNARPPCAKMIAPVLLLNRYRFLSLFMEVSTMASAAFRPRTSSRIVFCANLLCMAAIVGLLATPSVRATEPTTADPSSPTPRKAAGEPVRIDTGLVQGVAASESGDVVVFRG